MSNFVVAVNANLFRFLLAPSTIKTMKYSRHCIATCERNTATDCTMICGLYHTAVSDLRSEYRNGRNGASQSNSRNNWGHYQFGDRYNVVGIATRYGMGGPGIESRWGGDFLYPSRPALGPAQAPIQLAPGLFPGCKAAGAWC